jgi:hypothetical protein
MPTASESTTEERGSFASQPCAQCAIKMLIERYTDLARIVTHIGFEQFHADKCLDFSYV